MTPHREPDDDGDLKKGAVENAPDVWSAPARDEQAQPMHAVAVTEDVLSADADEVAEVEQILGADEEGTPG